MPVENSAACNTSIPSMPFWGHMNLYEEAFFHASPVRVSVKETLLSHNLAGNIYINIWTQIQRLIQTSATQFQETFFYLIFKSKIETYCFTYACYVSEEPIQFYVGNCNWTTWWVRERLPIHEFSIRINRFKMFLLLMYASLNHHIVTLWQMFK